MFLGKKDKISVLRSAWGKADDKYRNIDSIASYHNQLQLTGKDSIVDDKTWNDLNFDSVFSKMDRNTSPIGQQYLYHLLHKYENDENVLKKRFNLISHFKTNQSFRESIQLKLLGLKDSTSYFIPYLMLNQSIPSAKYYFLFYIPAALPFIMLLLTQIKSYFFLGLVGALLINVLLDIVYSRKIYSYYAGFRGLNSLIEAAIGISKIDPGIDVAELKIIKDRLNIIKPLKKKLGRFVINKEGLDELTLSLIEYFNMFFLVDITAYFRSVNVLLRYQEEIHEVYKAVASLDSSISIASFLTEAPNYTNPVFNNSDTVSFEDMYHPLIRDAVPNTLKKIDKSVLITGSNMSGKTTFIKTLGVNFILSQTLYLSLARSFNIPKCFVKTSIQRNEEMEEGKSYFWIEIEGLKNFIDSSGNGNKYLFLIDEIFRGTNTVERLASSTAVLKYIDKNNLVYVTTHDIELQGLLQDQYRMFHFSEQVEDGKFFFDYKINEGPCSSGNAIKLLEIMGYPGQITEEAKSIVKDLVSERLKIQ
jgi:DNA mismatch repair ATPase MutS